MGARTVHASTGRQTHPDRTTPTHASKPGTEYSNSSPTISCSYSTQSYISTRRSVDHNPYVDTPKHIHERTVAATCGQSSNTILCHPDCGVNLWKLIIYWYSCSIFLLGYYPFFTFCTSCSVQFHHFMKKSFRFWLFI